MRIEVMELNKYFKSLIDIDDTTIIICDLNHTIIYMNKFATDLYAKRNMNLLGSNLLKCHNEDSNEKILKVVEWFKKDVNNNFVHTFFNEKQNKDVYMVALRDDDGILIGYYEKHEYRNKDLTPFYNFD